jgi:transposase
MSPLNYYRRVQLKDHTRTLRYHLVRYALKNGIKPAARIFNTTPKTVRKWVVRWKNNLHQGLTDQRTIFRHRPPRIPENEREFVIRIKKKNKTWGALKIKEKYGLKISDKTIRRIWKEANPEKNDTAEN